MDNFKSISDMIDKNLPHILTGLGVAGVIGTGVSAAIAAPKAKKKIEELEDPTKWEMFCAAAPYYAPTVLIGSASIACIIAADRVSTGRYLALASSYAVMQNKLDMNTKKELKEALGLKTDKDKVKDKDKESSDKDNKRTTEDGVTNELKQLVDAEVLCKDEVTGVIFKATPAYIRNAEARVNEEIARVGNSTLSTFYDFMDLPYERYPNIASKIHFGNDYGIPAMEINISGDCDDAGNPFLRLSYKYSFDE